MDTSKPAPAIALAPIDEVVAALIQGSLPLETALAAWRSHHGLKMTEVSELIGYRPGAISSMIHAPSRYSGVRRAVARLIGYDRRGREGAASE